MKSLDLEWIANNWATASEADRLAAGKEMRKRLRAAMTQLEQVGRSLAPKHTPPATQMSRIQELRAEGLSIREAVAKIREQDAQLPAWQPDGAPQMRQQIRQAVDEAVDVIYDWADRCPDLQPAWTHLEGRALDLHTKLRLDDGEMNP